MPTEVRPGTPPEMRLLLALLRGHAEPLPPGADPARLTELVDYHRVALRLPAETCAALPAILQAVLAARRQAAAAEALALAGELGRLGRAFTSAGLPWVAVKGPAFGMLLHGRLGRRACRDLDLLVPAGVEAQATALLAGAGYVGPPRAPGIRQVELRHRVSGRLVELHVGMIDDDALFPERLFQPFRRAVPVEVGGTEVPTLPLEAALVFAAFHGCKHFWRRLFWLQDFADAADSGRVDWGAALSLARSLGCERHLSCALALARSLLGSPLPQALAGDRRLAAAGRDAAAVLDRTADLPAPANDGAAYRRIGPLRTLIWRLRLYRRWPARAAVLWDVLRPKPQDLAVIRLPAALAPLYLLIRPARLLLRTARGHPVRRM